MRISQSTKNDMKTQILSDLYMKTEMAFTERTHEIARRNRDYQLAPYLDRIAALPSELISMAVTYRVKISYRVDQAQELRGLSDIWTFRSDTPQVNPTAPPNKYSHTPDPATNDLDPRLQAETRDLAEEILKLRREKAELKLFLDETLELYSGPKQLKVAWPESLHKYIPVPKAKAAKAAPRAPTITAVAATAPSTLQTRMTKNLLEGE